MARGALDFSIVPYASETPSAVPVSGDMKTHEFAVNLTDKKAYMKDAGGSIVELPFDTGVATIVLGYTPAASQGTITNDSGADAVLPLASGSNAGLVPPADTGGALLRVNAAGTGYEVVDSIDGGTF